MPELVKDVKDAETYTELHDIVLISNTPDSSDNDINKEKVPANRTILSIRSKVFRKMLCGGPFSSEINQREIQLDFPAHVLRSLVHFCFTDEVQVNTMHDDDDDEHTEEEEDDDEEHNEEEKKVYTMVELFNAADFFAIRELQLKLEDQICITFHQSYTTRSIIWAASNIADHEGTGLEVFNHTQHCMFEDAEDATPEMLRDILRVSNISKIFNADTAKGDPVECYKQLEAWAVASDEHREAALGVLESIPFKDLDVNTFGELVDSGGLITPDFAMRVFREQAAMHELEVNRLKKITRATKRKTFD
jgi:hypothetical protein